MFRFERRSSHVSIGLAVAFLLGCGGIVTWNKPGLAPFAISPQVYERGVRTAVTLLGEAKTLSSTNGEIEDAFTPTQDLIDSHVTIPTSVPVGPYEVFIGDGKSQSSPMTIYVLSNEQPYKIDLERTVVNLGVQNVALAMTVLPPGPTTIEFELPTGVTATLEGDAWRSVGTPFDIGTQRLIGVTYKLNGELPPGDYAFKILWKKGGTTLSEDSGTIRVNEVENRLRVFNSRLNAPGNFFWEFPSSSIQRTIDTSSTTITFSDANRSVTLSANKPLPPGQYFVPTDVQVEYRQRTNTYECAYGYVVIEENSSGELYLRMREMSMMASGTTLQGYFSMEGIIRRSF